jgi:hypothetical protein
MRKHRQCLVLWSKESIITYCFLKHCMKSLKIDTNKKSFYKFSSFTLTIKKSFKKSFPTLCIILTALIPQVFQLYLRKSLKWTKVISGSTKPRTKPAVHLEEAGTLASTQKMNKVQSLHTI